MSSYIRSSNIQGLVLLGASGVCLLALAMISVELPSRIAIAGAGFVTSLVAVVRFSRCHMQLMQIEEIVSRHPLLPAGENETVGKVSALVGSAEAAVEAADCQMARLDMLFDGLNQGGSIQSELLSGIPKATAEFIQRIERSRDSVGKDIESLSEIAKGVARGDFELRVLSLSEGSQLLPLKPALNDIIDRCDAYIRETTACLRYVSEGKYFRRIVEEGMSGSFLYASKTINTAIEAIQKKMAAFGGVAVDFESKMSGVVAALEASASSLESGARVMTDAASSSETRSMEVAKVARQTATNVETFAAATEELSSSINEISRQVSQQSNVTAKAVAEANNAGAMIKQLDAAAAKIDEVVRLITDIAERTNLLALNATIEAARAGEAGRGFAVVAGEVKNLANQTAKATEEISGQITDIQTATRHSVGAIENIFATITTVNDISTTIAAAVEEQSAATQEIARNIEGVAAGTQAMSAEIQFVGEGAVKTRVSASEVQAAASALSEQAALVSGQVSRFGQELRKIV